MAEAKEEKITSFDQIESTIKSVIMSNMKDLIQIKYKNDYKVQLQVSPMCCDKPEFVVLDDFPLSNLIDEEIVKITEDDKLLHYLSHIKDEDGCEYISKHVYKIELKSGKNFYLGATDESNGYYDLTFSVIFT